MVLLGIYHSRQGVALVTVLDANLCYIQISKSAKVQKLQK